MSGFLILLVGTTKGAFLIEGDCDRQNWSLRGPYCEGWRINHVIGNSATGALWAAGGGAWEGAGVWRSQDGGATWTLSRLAHGEFNEWLAKDPDLAAQIGRTPEPPAPFTDEVDALWSLALNSGTLYAGAKPARLFSSSDNGQTWEPLPGLSDHPSAETWQPGAAGLTLHTIVACPDDPARLWVAISAAGVFASEDGGQSWARRVRRSNADGSGADGDAEIGLCVHNMVRASGDGDLLYQQNHHGVFRSPDGGRSWHDVSDGLPSRFGFPIAVHPRDPQTVWVLPLNGDSLGRYPPDASAAIWRSRDGGETWSACRDGLPARDCFFTVLRQAMATDRSDPAGLYFGTNTGSVFASTDEGETWREIARHLPTILCVETLQPS